MFYHSETFVTLSHVLIKQPNSTHLFWAETKYLFKWEGKLLLMAVIKKCVVYIQMIEKGIRIIVEWLTWQDNKWICNGLRRKRSTWDCLWSKQGPSHNKLGWLFSPKKLNNQMLNAFLSVKVEGFVDKREGDMEKTVACSFMAPTLSLIPKQLELDIDC